jgi:hypothetical protein
MDMSEFTDEQLRSRLFTLGSELALVASYNAYSEISRIYAERDLIDAELLRRQETSYPEIVARQEQSERGARWAKS